MSDQQRPPPDPETPKASAQSGRELRRAHGEWLPPDLQHLRVARLTDGEAVEVDRALRLRPDELIHLAYGHEGPVDPSDSVALSANPATAWLRVPVRVECWTPTREGSEAVISIRWQATRLRRFFPVMQADLAVRPHDGAQCELVLDGRYRPPLGLLGLVSDRLFGRWVALGTARRFLDQLGAAIEHP